MRCLLALLLILAPLFAQGPMIINDLPTAQKAVRDLKANPRDNNLAGALLEFYLFRWQDQTLRADRLKLLLWFIANRPDIDLADSIHDVRGMNVDPDDKEAYTQVREAWMRQAARQDKNARVLANAARVLRLTDRKLAATWLKTAATYDSENVNYENSLAMVYADALTGLAAMTPMEEPTRLDPEETKSLFARQAREEVEQDSILSARTGWNIHLIAMSLRGLSLTATDYDNVAEDLLLNAANLDYPKPSKLAFLAQFYRDQFLKVTHRVLPKFVEVEVKPADEVKMLFGYPKHLIIEELTAPMKVPVTVTIGIDGHIWKAESVDRKKNPLATYATGAMMEKFTFKPLRISGEPVQVTTSFDVTLEPAPPKPTKR